MLIDPKHAKAAVLGWPVKHSLSPRLHGYWLKAYGVVGEYTALPVAPDDLAKVLRSLPSLGLSGVNLTVPHKEAALALVDHIEPLALRVGAINTVKVSAEGKLLGRNTDVYGFSQNLLAAGYRPGGAAVLLGAGGAARAGLVALLDMGITDIRLMNRTRGRAETLAAELAPGYIRVFDWNDLRALAGAGLLANATVLGLNGQPPLDLALDTLPLDAWVTDMVYAPLETDLLRRAAGRGNRTVDGLGMLLHQAKPAFHAFFGIDPEVTPDLRAHVLEGLAC